jgi:ATP-dependent Lon protease
VALNKPTIENLVILGELTIGGSIKKVDNLADTLQVALDSGAKKVLIPSSSAGDLGTVPSELMSSFTLIFYNSIEDAVFKALGLK